MFTSTIESLSETPSLSNKFNGEDISISHQHIIDQLNKVNPNKSCGPDKIHPRVIKEIKDSLILPLLYIFTKSLHEGTLPVSWKGAIITPIHKKGSRKVRSNYRPISLTSVFCRMLESSTTCFSSNNIVSVPGCHVLHSYYMQ